MTWHVESIGKGALAIMNGNLIVGSIVKQANECWRVEVMMIGAADHIYEAATVDDALDFVRGVEARQTAGLSDPFAPPGFSSKS